MDIFFSDPNEVPLPPNEVRIRVLKAEPWPDRQRLHVHLEVDPFQKRPSLELVVHNPDSSEIANTSIIETMDRKIEFTMHLRGERPPGTYTIRAELFYSEPVPEPETPGSEPKEMPRPRITVVDRAQSSFELIDEPGA